ncbi:MAG: hypothetical protein JF617_09515 [Burkholderiales bacterium]|nr:hypothetical protein [Burkholderiales bacterium]
MKTTMVDRERVRALDANQLHAHHRTLELLRQRTVCRYRPISMIASGYICVS